MREFRILVDRPSFPRTIVRNNAHGAYLMVAFFRGVRNGRADAAGPVGQQASDAIAATLVVQERYGLAIHGRDRARWTETVAERFGQSVWQGDDVQRDSNDPDRPWM